MMMMLEVILVVGWCAGLGVVSQASPSNSSSSILPGLPSNLPPEMQPDLQIGESALPPPPDLPPDLSPDATDDIEPDSTSPPPDLPLFIFEEEVVTMVGGCRYQDLCEESCARIFSVPEVACRQCRDLGCGSVFENDGLSSCSCDALCLFHGDCCEDFEETCPEVYDRATEVVERTANVSKPGCQVIEGVGLQELNLVNMCAGEVCEIDSGGVNADQYPLPVTDLDLGAHYTTVECAKCNGARNFAAWKACIPCPNGTR